MTLQKVYRVKKIYGRKEPIEISVPGSKSITNRALLIAALAEGESRLTGALFSKDSEDMIHSLASLGIEIRADEERKEIVVKGCGGKLPVREGEIHVGNSGITARFITVLLAFSGGEFSLTAGEQMTGRPMKELIEALRNFGIEIHCEKEEGFFPFRIKRGERKKKEISVDTTISSQFLSGLLISGFLLEEGLQIFYTGRNDNLPYVDITLHVMEAFGLQVEKEEGRYKILSGQSALGRQYEIEPDVSSACYFYAMAVLLKRMVTVKGVHLDSIQGDIRFLSVLERLGATVMESEGGVGVIGNVEDYNGVDVDLNSFSDQTMTLAALALFAKGHTTIRGIKHIRFQETNRLLAIHNEVIRLGGLVEKGEDSITIFPLRELDREVEVETYKDHRMAMAFTLVGLRSEGVIILNPDCVNKSFANYFELIDEIVKE